MTYASVTPESLPGHLYHLPADSVFRLDNGTNFSDLRLAYQTYGHLNGTKSNAILICHALTGDQFANDPQPLTGKPGWWEILIGPGKVIDTDHYFVICINVLGGCMGSVGPASINPATGLAYGLDFPVITIRDIVNAQKMVIDHLGIEKLFAVIGGSMGGMQALQWGVSYPERMHAVVPIATAARHSAQNIAFHEVGRQAIMADPDWCQGNYLAENKKPRRGLSVARMTAHITYLSESALHTKFGRSLQDRSQVTYGFDADFQVESYLRHQGMTFVDRFDANSYLYVTRAMDYFDLSAEHNGQLAQAFQHSTPRYCLFSFSSDWMFPTEESRQIVRALNAVAGDVSFAEIDSDKGHDAFLLPIPEFHDLLNGFLDGCALQCGLSSSHT